MHDPRCQRVPHDGPCNVANNPQQDHNWDCGACGAPCKADGHVDCPRGGGFTTTRVLRCWNHSLKKVTSGEPVVRTVSIVPERPMPSWVDRAKRAMPHPWPVGRGAAAMRREVEHPKPLPTFTKPLRPVPGPRAKPIDADLAALIDNEADKADGTLRERLEKGDV